MKKAHKKTAIRTGFYIFGALFIILVLYTGWEAVLICLISHKLLKMRMDMFDADMDMMEAQDKAIREGKMKEEDRMFFASHKIDDCSGFDDYV